MPEPAYLAQLQSPLQQQEQQEPAAGGGSQQGPSQQEQQQHHHQQPQQREALALAIKPHVMITAERLGGAAASCVAWRHGSQVWQAGMALWHGKQMWQAGMAVRCGNEQVAVSECWPSARCPHAL